MIISNWLTHFPIYQSKLIFYILMWVLCFSTNLIFLSLITFTKLTLTLLVAFLLLSNNIVYIFSILIYTFKSRLVATSLKRDNSKFNSVGKAMRNQSTIFPKNLWQLTNNKANECRSMATYILKKDGIIKETC